MKRKILFSALMVALSSQFSMAITQNDVLKLPIEVRAGCLFSQVAQQSENNELDMDLEALDELIDDQSKDELEDVYRDRDLPDLNDSVEKWFNIAWLYNVDKPVVILA